MKYGDRIVLVQKLLQHPVILGLGGLGLALKSYATGISFIHTGVTAVTHRTVQAAVMRVSVGISPMSKNRVIIIEPR